MNSRRLKRQKSTFVTNFASSDPKKMQSFCKARWDWLMNKGTINTSVSKKWFDIVSTHYQESQRHYHTLEHIEELLLLSEKYSTSLSFQDHVEYSIWFHDVIYDPKRDDNEEKSVDRWCEFANEAQLTKEQTELISKYIILTKTHKVDPTESDLDLKYFLDMDMSILGREQTRYDLYTRQVRQEYIHVPDSIFFDKRPFFLEKLIEGGIYITPEFISVYEENAKQNVQREINALRSSNFL